MSPSHFLDNFLESTTDFAVVTTLPDGTITAWRGAAARVLGYSPDEALGMSLSALFTPEDRALGLDAQEIAVALTHGRSEDDRWHVRKDGSRFWASGVLAALRAPGGSPTGLCKVLRDKTDVRIQIASLQNELAERTRELDALRQTVAAVAHELRNPLMPMGMAVSLLQRGDAAHVADKAVKSLAHQLGTLKAVVEDLNRAAADDMVTALDIGRVNLNTTLAETVEEVAELARERQLQLSLVLPPADVFIAADAGRLHQMLLNLLGNALKYTPASGSVFVTASVEGGMGVVRVEDSGVGIAPEALGRIFEMFTREGRHPGIEGHGVGLAVVKHLAMLHGGSVEARSPGHDKGSVFGLRIPLAQDG